MEKINEEIKNEMKQQLIDTSNGEVLMHWDLIRIPEDSKDVTKNIKFKFAATIVNEDFGKNTFSFYTEDGKNYIWLFDPEQKLSEKNLADDKVIVKLSGGPIELDFEKAEESTSYLAYVLENVNAAGYYFSKKAK